MFRAKEKELEYQLHHEDRMMLTSNKKRATQLFWTRLPQSMIQLEFIRQEKQ